MKIVQDTAEIHRENSAYEGAAARQLEEPAPEPEPTQAPEPDTGSLSEPASEVLDKNIFELGGNLEADEVPDTGPVEDTGGFGQPVGGPTEPMQHPASQQVSPEMAASSAKFVGSLVHSFTPAVLASVTGGTRAEFEPTQAESEQINEALANCIEHYQLGAMNNPAVALVIAIVAVYGSKTAEYYLK